MSLNDVTLIDAAQQLADALPEEHREAWGELCQATLQNEELVQICLLGAFSAGKTSLLNMLLGEELLPVGLEEKTALPTLIRYGEEQRVELLEDQAPPQVVSVEEAHRLASTPSPTRRILSLYASRSWLRGVLLIDLPGTGTMSPERRAVTRAFMRDSDLILYTLEPRGPSALDLELLREVQGLGKRLQVLVTRWDQVERSAAEDTRPVSLHTWEQELTQELGAPIKLMPTSAHTQRGKEELIHLLSRASRQLQEIRETRFRVEADTFLAAVLARHEEELKVVAQATAAQQEELRVQLRARREQLLNLKRDLFEEHRQEYERANRQLEQHSASEVDKLRAGLAVHKAQLFHQGQSVPDAWTIFLRDGRESCQQRIEASAQHLSELLEKLGLQSPLHRPQLEALNLDLPALPALSPDEFLEEGRLHSIQESLAAYEQELSQLSAAPQPEASPEDQQLLQAQLERIAETIQHTQQLPLDMIQELQGGSKLGARVGRVLGEIVDTAMLVVPGPTQLKGLVKLLGGGAKAIKFAKMVAKPFQMANKGVQALRKGRHTVFKELGLHKLQGPGGHSLFEWLDVFSVGFVLEKLGGNFDSAPELIEYPDPDQVRARDADLKRLDQERIRLQAQLDKLNHELEAAELTEVRLRELQRLRERHQERLGELQTQAALRYKQAVEKAHALWLQRIEHLADQAARHWEVLFLRNLEGMTRTFLRHLNEHSEHTLRQRLDEHERFLTSLEERLGQTEHERAAREDLLKQRHHTLLNLKQTLGAQP